MSVKQEVKRGGGTKDEKEGGDTYDSGRWIDDAREGVDGDDVAGGFVPRTVFPPVGGGNLFPGVVKRAIIGIDPHCARVALVLA